jgi:hypothetical protein
MFETLSGIKDIKDENTKRAAKRIYGTRQAGWNIPDKEYREWKGISGKQFKSRRAIKRP